jgi:hypothetical protein
MRNEKWEMRSNSKSLSEITHRMRKKLPTRSCRFLVATSDLPHPDGKIEVKRS